MASFLRQIVAGPRLPHPEAGLDLCYVTDTVIATSGPSSNYPQRAYRTPVKDLVNFLDARHGDEWCIWEFRAEGTGYPDSEVYGRIHHFPFPDHHPPPFALIPKVMASMRNWLYRLDGLGAGNTNEDIDTDAGIESGTEAETETETKTETKKKGQRVAVVHCKAGKGRSGTIACSYLISQEGWKMDDALQRFTERRMRVGFGSGVSIPSQVRWVQYVDRWTNEMGKKYVERPVEIIELHIWGLRDEVKVAVEGFVEEGQRIKCFHLFHRDERILMHSDGAVPDDDRDGNGNGNASPSQEPLSAKSDPSTSSLTAHSIPNPSSLPSSSTEPPVPVSAQPHPPTKQTSAVLLRPKTPILLPTSDINIELERRSKKAAYTGLAMVTSIAHVWFNAYFEGGDKFDSGVFEAEWDALDGIKGTTKKGIKALDRLKVVWRYPPPTQVEAAADIGPVPSGVITEPKPGEPIPESHPTDWRLRDTDSVVGNEDGDDNDQPDGDKENIPM